MYQHPLQLFQHPCFNTPSSVYNTPPKSAKSVSTLNQKPWCGLHEPRAGGTERAAGVAVDDVRRDDGRSTAATHTTYRYGYGNGYRYGTSSTVTGGNEREWETEMALPESCGGPRGRGRRPHGPSPSPICSQEAYGSSHQTRGILETEVAA